MMAMNDASQSAGGTERLERWVREHGPALQGFLWALVRDQHAVDDLLQEVFCRAWESRDRYRDTGQERAYLLRIADRLVKDRARRRWRERPVQLSDTELEVAAADGSPLDAILRREAQKQLAAALDGLTEPQRRTLLLRYYGDISFAEIAAVMKCPLSTVLSHCRRGLVALRQLLVEETA